MYVILFTNVDIVCCLKRNGKMSIQCQWDTLFLLNSLQNSIPEQRYLHLIWYQTTYIWCKYIYSPIRRTEQQNEYHLPEIQVYIQKFPRNPEIHAWSGSYLEGHKYHYFDHSHTQPTQSCISSFFGSYDFRFLQEQTSTLNVGQTGIYFVQVHFLIKPMPTGKS